MSSVAPTNFNIMPSSISTLPYTTNLHNSSFISTSNLENLNQAEQNLQEGKRTWSMGIERTKDFSIVDRVKRMFFTTKGMVLNNRSRNKRAIPEGLKRKFEETINDIDIKDGVNIDFLGKIPERLHYTFLMHLKGQLRTNQEWEYLAKAFKFLTDFYNRDDDSLKYDRELINNIHDVFQLFEKTPIENAFQLSVFESCLEMSGMDFITSPAKANIYLKRLNDVLNIPSDSDMHKNIFSSSRILFNFNFLEDYSFEEFQEVRDNLANAVRSSFKIFNSYNYEQHNQGESSVCVFMQDALVAYGKLVQIRTFKKDSSNMLRKEMGTFFKNTQLKGKELKIIRHLIYFYIKDHVPIKIKGRIFPFGFGEKVVFQNIYPYWRHSFLADEAAGFKGINVFSAVSISGKLQQQISSEFKSAFEKRSVANPAPFNMFIAKDLASYSVYNEQFLEKPAEYFFIVQPGYPDEYYEETDTFTLSEHLSDFLRVSKQSLSIAVYSKDNLVLDLKRKYEKALAHTINIPITQRITNRFTPSPSIALPTYNRTTKAQSSTTEASTTEQTVSTTPIEEISSTLTTQELTTEEVTSTSAEQTVSTTPVEVSTTFTTQELATEEVTSTSTEQIVSTTPIEEISSMLTTQELTTEEVTSTSAEQTISTTPIEEISSMLTTQELTTEEVTSASTEQTISTTPVEISSMLTTQELTTEEVTSTSAEQTISTTPVEISSTLTTQELTTEEVTSTSAEQTVSTTPVEVSTTFATQELATEEVTSASAEQTVSTTPVEISSTLTTQELTTEEVTSTSAEQTVSTTPVEVSTTFATQELATEEVTSASAEQTVSTTPVEVSTTFATQELATEEVTSASAEQTVSTTPVEISSTLTTQELTTEEVTSTSAEQTVSTTPVEISSTLTTQELTTEEVTNTPAEQTVSTTPVEISSMLTTQELTTEEVTSTSTEQISTTPVEISSTLTTQDLTTEEVTSTSTGQITSTTPIEEISPKLTTQGLTVEKARFTIQNAGKNATSVSIEDTTEGMASTTDTDPTEYVTVIPTPQNPIIKPLATLVGIFSGIFLLMGLLFYRRRKKGSYKTQEGSELVSRFEVPHPSFQDGDTQV